MTTRKRSTRLLALEKQAEVEATERRRQHDELEAKGRELRHAKREQTRAERAAEREERLRQKEVMFTPKLASDVLAMLQLSLTTTISASWRRHWRHRGKKRLELRLLILLRGMRNLLLPPLAARLELLPLRRLWVNIP